jgi:hypothetical protein
LQAHGQAAVRHWHRQSLSSSGLDFRGMGRLTVSDHKFERKYDRRVVLEDEKNRLIDLTDFSQLPPEVGIYDEPVRYFKANHEWCKFIFGWLTWMQSVSFWKDAQDSNYHAIQQILIFEEGIEGEILMDSAEFKQALYEGLYRWTNDVAKQIVSGGTTNFVVDDEGNVTQPGDAITPPVVDDPETPENEGLEAQSGAAITLAHGLVSIVERLLELYGGDASADVPEDEANAILSAEYSTDSNDFDAAIADYYAYRATSVVSFIVLDEDELSEILFCSDLDISAAIAYVMNLPEVFAERNIVAELFISISDEQKAKWIAKGQGLPSTEYKIYGCTPVPYEEITLDMASANFPQKTTNSVHKEGHRIQFDISGSFTDVDNPNIVQDFFYEHNTATDGKTFLPGQFQIQRSGLAEPTQSEVPFEPSHEYHFTIDISPTGGLSAIIVGRDNGVFALPNTTGTLLIKITDLGEYVP